MKKNLPQKIKPVTQPEIKEIPARQKAAVPPVLTVKEFADILKLPVTKIIATLMKNGVIATINESIDAETAMIVGDELGFDIEEQAPEIKETITEAVDKGKRIPRPPVVTIMGHVDHGKTTLLDNIRRANVVATESGGITQHIGAYQVSIIPKDSKKERLITFLDTPGHEAFSAMRAHGASITDIVVLVVAADDGVKPQTIEAINHARAAGVPIIVAINKIDLPGANPERVKQELTEQDLVSEEWGGKTIMVSISAKSGKGLQDLLEMILLVADMRNLTTNPDKTASGVVVESHMQPGAGPRATILINDGTLRQGDAIVIGNTYGKIRFMEDFRGRRIKEATAAKPVSIAGLQEVLNFGEPVVVVESEKIAREMTQVKSAVRHVMPVSINEVSSDEEKTQVQKSLKIIIKTDVQGSLEAIHSSIERLISSNCKIDIINEGVGDINESDVNLAATTQALVIGFRVSISPQVGNFATREHVKISLYDIIYQLLDDLYALLSETVVPEKIVVELGKLKILQIFRTTKSDQIIGGMVTKGKIISRCQARVIRDKENIGEVKITSLHVGTEEVTLVEADNECGLGVEGEIKVQEKDVLEAYEVEERLASIK